jgi:hypothetical protein
MNYYCYVENGTIVEGPGPLPKSWRNISGLDWLDVNQLKEIGWLPHVAVDGPANEKYDTSTFEITDSQVIETRLWREYTADERAEILERDSRNARNHRNWLLKDSDWTQLPDCPLSSGKKSDWALYRQSLRDVTSQTGFPQNIVWPTIPAE